MASSYEELKIKITADTKDLKALQRDVNQAKNELVQANATFAKGSQELLVFENRLKAAQNALNGARDSIKQAGVSAKMSSAQWLEFGENLTVVASGLSVLGISITAFIKTAVTQAAELEVYSKKFVELAGNEEQARLQLENLRTASAGNLNDIELVKYSNKMRLLGVSVEDTIQILDIVERKADEVGVSFSEGESALQSFIVTGRGRALKELGINLADVTRQMQIMTGYTIEQINKLEQDEIATIRLNAIKKLYGDTLENIGKKQKDSGDKLTSLTTAYENLSTGIGGVILPLFNELYGVYQKIDNVTKGLTGSTLSFGSALTEIVGYVYKVTNPIIALGVELSNLWDILQKFTGGDTSSNKSGATGDFGDPEANAGTTSNTNADRERRRAEIQKLRDEAQIGSDNFKFYDAQLKEFETTVKKTGGTSKGTSKEISTITNQIIRLNKSLADLQAEQLSLGESAKGTSIFTIYLQQIQEIQDKLKYLNSPFKDSTGLDFITNLPKYDNSQNIKGQELSFAEQVNLTGIDKEAMQKEAYDKIVNGSQQALSNVENIFQILDIGTETFVSKLVSGFQSALSIIDTIKQVLESINSVKQGIGILGSLLSFVPGGGFIGTATAGIGTLGGGGRNIGNLSTGGGQSPMVNKIYINSTLDTQKFFGDGVTTFYKNRNLNTVG